MPAPQGPLPRVLQSPGARSATQSFSAPRPAAAAPSCTARVPAPAPRGSHSRICSRASAPGCSGPWLLRPRPPDQRPQVRPRAPMGPGPSVAARPARVTAWERRAVRGAAAAPPRSCPARPAAAGAGVAAQQGGRLAAGARAPGLGRWGGRLGAPIAPPLCCSARLLSAAALAPLCSALLPASARRPSQPGLRRPGPGAHVTGACEHAPRGPRPRPAPAPSPRPCPLPARPPEPVSREDPGAEGGDPRAGAGSCCFRSPQRGPGWWGLCARSWVWPEESISPQGRRAGVRSGQSRKGLGAGMRGRVGQKTS